MPASTIGDIAALLAESLIVWHLDGDVRDEGAAIAVTCGSRSLRVVPAPVGAPFPWLVQTAEKSRGAASVVALLRTVRAVLDPDHAGSRLRLAPHGILPP
jgi:hypothetical protein